MFYYYVPRCTVAGRVVVDGASEQVVGGLGWYDHEFGGVSPERANVRLSADARQRA
jgi:predicted secreted hydrolase